MRWSLKRGNYRPRRSYKRGEVEVDTELVEDLYSRPMHCRCRRFGETLLRYPEARKHSAFGKNFHFGNLFPKWETGVLSVSLLL